MNSKNITDTGSRLLKNLNNVNQQFYNNQNVEYKINDAVTDSMITVGEVLKVYPALNKSLVRLFDGRKVVCINNLIMGGDIMLLYTPTGDADYCEYMHEPCVIPRGRLECIVSPFNNGGDEWLLLGYYDKDEFVGFNPSKNGQFKILAFGSLGEYSIRFGVRGLEIVTHGEIRKTVLDSWGQDITTGMYSKDEVDDLLSSCNETILLLENRIKVLEEKLNITDGTGDGTGTGTDGGNADTDTGG